MGGGKAEQGIEAAVGPGGVGSQRAVLQGGAPLADADGPAQMVADFGGDDGVAAVDGVLDVAQDVGEADLVGAPQFLLSGVAVRQPDLRTMVAQKLGPRSGPGWGRCRAARPCRNGRPTATG